METTISHNNFVEQRPNRPDINLIIIYLCDHNITWYSVCVYLCDHNITWVYTCVLTTLHGTVCIPV